MVMAVPKDPLLGPIGEINFLYMIEFALTAISKSLSKAQNMLHRVFGRYFLFFKLFIIVALTRTEF